MDFKNFQQSPTTYHIKRWRKVATFAHLNTDKCTREISNNAVQHTTLKVPHNMPKILTDYFSCSIVCFNRHLLFIAIRWRCTGS
jgi:hypothetical protein